MPIPCCHSLPPQDESGREVYRGYHLAVSGAAGQLTVMAATNLQPLVHHQVVPSKQVGESGE